MISITLTEFARMCGGKPPPGRGQIVAQGVSIDSRTIRPGQVFFALKGKRWDGHQFVTDALQAGAVAVVVEESQWSVLPVEVRAYAIRVRDTVEALGRCAAIYRQRFQIPFIAVVGSNGKTSVKELLGTVLQAKGNPLVTSGNRNNHIGVPLTLLELSSNHTAAVLEVGTNHPGELRPLLQQVCPTHGVLTAIGPEHLEFFKDLDGVVQEEGTIAEFIPPDGSLVLPDPCSGAEQITCRCRGSIVRVGTGRTAHWQIGHVRVHRQGTTWKIVKAPSKDWVGFYRIGFFGAHHARNATLAIAMASVLGVSPDLARSVLAKTKPIPGRFALETVGKICLIDDTYNANADSMIAALETLRTLRARRGRTIAVLGSMGELGLAAPQEHQRVGRRVAELGIDALFTLGEEAHQIAEAARAAGMRSVFEHDRPTLLSQTLLQMIRPYDVILFKASRFVQLERVLEEVRIGLQRRNGQASRRSRQNSQICSIC